MWTHGRSNLFLGAHGREIHGTIETVAGSEVSSSVAALCLVEVGTDAFTLMLFCKVNSLEHLATFFLEVIKEDSHWLLDLYLSLRANLT